MSLKRIHLLDTDAPLREGENTGANCGFVVPKVSFAAMADWENGGIFRQPLDSCQKCVKRAQKLRYTYALLPGQESEEA